ncbi:MAG: putative peptidoglycan glycosyltransferase FtsW [Candidatus Pacebacteria bacterium]|nr:putative peptidoglycan glycosyltransferase FtsW [Candidatus Paceibacterota bacterium]
MKKNKIDRIFLILTILLVSVGFFVFTSASLGLYVRKGFSLQNIFFDQTAGLLLGIVLLTIAIKTPLRLLRKYALHLFIASVVFSFLVFVPHLGFSHNGASRWISLKYFSLQPSEMLKLATVIYFASILPLLRDRIKTMKYSLGIMLGVLAMPAIVLFFQKDTGTLMVIVSAVLAMLVASGAKIRHLSIMIVIIFLGIGALAMVRPHVKERILTFFDPSRDPQGASYQIQKSLIAIGSGGIVGRGFGQSVQKYGTLPEPTGDSIFAVMGEEFGFVGATLLILLFLLFGIRGMQVANASQDSFSGLLAVGIVILIISQSFVNIAAMLGLIPLTGLPLVFVSHGGTAIVFSFIEVGILLNISRHTLNKKNL